MPVRPPYTLNDMARDTVGLMDALGIGEAHVVGASMGGMIAQIVAIEHPERVKSLTSIMSTSGDRALPGPKGQVLQRAVRRSYRPDGFARQLIAIQTAPSWVLKLRGIRAPTLVLHGSHDPLVPLAGGEDTAANIPGARLRIVPGMGHFLPEALIPLLVDEIAGHCLKAENATQIRGARAAGSSPSPNCTPSRSTAAARSGNTI